MDELEHYLSSILYSDPLLAVIATITTNQSKVVFPQLLSKLWYLNPDLAKGAVDQNTQHCRHGSDNKLSRQFSTNHCEELQCLPNLMQDPAEVNLVAKLLLVTNIL